MKHHNDRGFNLIEVLLAMGIFAIGFVAIASVFPAGALLQRNAANESLSRQVSDNAKAIASTIQIDYDSDGSAAGSDDLNGMDSVFTVQALPAATLTTKWTESARSYPSYITNSQDRDFYWVPLVQLTDTGAAPEPEDWRVFLFILRRDGGETYSNAAYPAVGSGRSSTSIPGLNVLSGSRHATNAQIIITSSATGLIAGDKILTDEGNIFTVKSVDGVNVTINSYVQNGWSGNIWYAPPADGDTQSPAMHIVGPLPTIVKEK